MIENKLLLSTKMKMDSLKKDTEKRILIFNFIIIQTNIKQKPKL